MEPCNCRLPHVGSSSTLSPSASTNLSCFGSSDFCISPGAQLTSPIGSGLSSNSTSTNPGLSFVSPHQGMPWRPRQDSPASAPPHWGPTPMLGQDWLPQHPSLAAQLSQIRSERQRPGVVPVDVLEGMWGFDDLLPEPGRPIFFFAAVESSCKGCSSCVTVPTLFVVAAYHTMAGPLPCCPSRSQPDLSRSL